MMIQPKPTCLKCGKELTAEEIELNHNYWESLGSYQCKKLLYCPPIPVEINHRRINERLNSNHE